MIFVLFSGYVLGVQTVLAVVGMWIQFFDPPEKDLKIGFQLLFN
jgi:hypothetical protein